MPYGTVNADTLVTSTSGGILGAGNASIMKNRIINGAMVIDQRATSISATGYSVDRWRIYNAASSKMTAAQSSTAPTGFSKSLLLTSTSAFTIPANYDGWMAQQYIEGFNTADLMWGTANAKTVTLSFWVYSSLTGTFGGSIANSAGNRSYPFSYTINSANTWEYETITIAGDTSGTWIGATNGIGLKVNLSVGMGSDYINTAGAWATGEYYSVAGATSIIGTNGATWYLTGVQLEVGSSATGYEYENYTSLLNKCYRYFQSIAYTDQTIVSTGTADGTSGCQAPINLLQTMRTAPTITLPTVAKTTGTQAFLTSGGTYPTTVGTHTTPSISVNQFRINASGYTAAFVQGNATWLYSTGSTTISASAEL